jgi:serine/threonine protein kinase
MLSKGTILGGNWKIENFLGEGACAKVYNVTSTGKSTAYEVVAKVIETGNGGKSKKDKDQAKLCDTLYYEHVLYTGLLSEFPYRAQLPVKNSGVEEEKKLRYLVMEKFDFDLRHFVKANASNPGKIADIGLQILKGLQWLHQKGFVYIDVKPDNFMLKGNKVYFVDCKFSNSTALI